MTPYVLLLRGINVGGHHPLPMKRLVALLEELGCESVRTYIQSGNVVLRSRLGAARLAAAVRRAIEQHHGFAPDVHVLTLREWDAAIAANPFPEADPQRVHFGFLDATPTAPDLERMAQLQSKSERFRLIGRVFYLHAPDGIGKSKLAAQSERLLGVAMTDRNGRTVRSIHELTRKTSAQ